MSLPITIYNQYTLIEIYPVLVSREGNFLVGGIIEITSLINGCNAQFIFDDIVMK